MRSDEIIREAVQEPGVKAVAAALKVSAALVYKWCEPTGEGEDPEQSGAKNPLDRVSEMYQLTKDVRLINWLCNEAGGFFVANPDPGPRRSFDEDVFNATRKMFRDFSELLDTVSEAVEDDRRIDSGEASDIRQKWEDLKSIAERFVLACEAGHYHRQTK